MRSVHDYVTEYEECSVSGIRICIRCTMGLIIMIASWIRFRWSDGVAMWAAWWPLHNVHFMFTVVLVDKQLFWALMMMLMTTSFGLWELQELCRLRSLKLRRCRFDIVVATCHAIWRWWRFGRFVQFQVVCFDLPFRLDLLGIDKIRFELVVIELGNRIQVFAKCQIRLEFTCFQLAGNLVSIKRCLIVSVIQLVHWQSCTTTTIWMCVVCVNAVEPPDAYLHANKQGQIETEIDEPYWKP